MILPFTVLRRLDRVIEPAKPQMLKVEVERRKKSVNSDTFLFREAKEHFYDTSPLDIKRLMGDQKVSSMLPVPSNNRCSANASSLPAET